MIALDKQSAKNKDGWLVGWLRTSAVAYCMLVLMPFLYCASEYIYIYMQYATHDMLKKLQINFMLYEKNAV